MQRAPPEETCPGMDWMSVAVLHLLLPYPRPEFGISRDLKLSSSDSSSPILV